jgi:hypothetical protein
MKTNGIIMAVGAPNQCRDGRKTMCAIILTQDLGLIRIYPIPASEKFSVWSFVDIDIERSQSDTRHESYKVTDYKVGNIIDDKEEKRRILNRCIIRSGTVDPLQFQNDNLSSIAMVKLPFGTLEFTLSQRIPETRRDDEEHPWILTQAAHWAKPYLSWISEQGTQHKTHLVGREVYMGLQHNADNPWNLFNNLQVNNPDYECWMLLGNMKDRRNVWVAPHIHRLKKNASNSTQPCFSIFDGKQDDWPYSIQAAGNVAVVKNQLQLFTTESITPTDHLGNTQTMS